ncbi:bromodomain adjacent to zinc finger domain protein 2B isoform X19 [Latimeria chalumnae]|uniref:bromodomain adjacent to zinc finger domain protein 2B isoform X19 n=1 Tax=Latimeria chalumnae TaxID=7897 RepID=UPI00313E57CC
MYMESGEWLASSSASSSITSASATATGTSKSSLSSGATALTSTLTTCGHLLRAAGDPPFNLSAVSSAFPMVSHPVFGIHTTSSGRSEFGGLGTLGASAALATHAQLSPFPGVEWWRTTDVHARAGAPFFPPLLGIPQLFAPSPQNHDSSSFHSRTTNENGQSTQKGNNCMNGAVNGSSIISTSDVSASQATTTTSSSGQAKVIKSGGHGRICSQEQTKSQLLDTEAEKFKNKKPRKKTVDSSSNSESDSGSSSDSSSEGMSSSDSEDLEEDDEDEDQSVEESEDDDSDSESEAQHKNKTKVLMHSVKEVKNDEKKALEQKSQDKRTHQQIPLAADLQTRASFQPQQKQPQVLSQQLNFVFQSSQAKEESANKHPSVIQSTGLAPSVKPLSLVNQAKKETSPKLIVPSPEIVKAGNKNTSDEKGSPINDLRMKREQFKQTFPVQLKKQQEQYKNQKKVTGAVSSLKSTYVSPIHQKLLRVDGNHSNPFLANALLGHHQPNGVIQSVIQEAPLALTTKSRSQAKTNEKLIPNSTSTTFCSPVNLSTTVKNHSSNPMTVVKPSTSPALIQASGKDNLASNNLLIGVKTHLYTAPKSLDQCRGTDSDIPSSKDSDDSNEDDDEEDDEEDDDEEEDTDDSQSESDSNSETDSDGSEEDKGQDETETDTEGEKTPLKLYKTTPSKSNSSTGQLAHSAPLNLQLIKDSNSVPAALARSPASPVFLGTSAALSSPSTPSGSVKRRRITDERELRIPLEYGWQREIRIKNIGGRLQGEVAYYAPCGKKLRQYPEVIKYLNRNGITDITRDNFSFSAKIRVGDFYEARDGPQGMQWCLLKEEEIIPRIRSMEGRRGRPPNPDRQRVREELRMRRRKGRPPNVGTSEFPDSNNTKLLRKLQAQEIARQAAQIKLLRKLQKQEQARAAKEARKQQAIIAAEEKRKQKEQLKILKQQEKIKRIQQVRMEKELRAQQILEAKRKKKEEAANAKIVEAEKRIKEKEMRRQQAVLLKHQELERHRLDMVWERERRRQHMMLMKAMEARKKAEEKERLKQEKRDEKRLNKERKLEQRRLELEMAKELKKPNEDMCLADQKPLPELSRIPGLVLSGNTFSDCLMVVQFLRNFGKVLGFDVNIDVPSMSVLQEGLLNVGDSMGEVQDLLVRLLSAAVCDPGVPSGHKVKTALGDNLMNVGINRDNVSEILQIYMEAHCGQTELTESLTTKAFQAHTPAQKASVLAFLVNELACSKSIVSEIDKNIDYMSNLRRDKWMVEGKLRKLRIIHAKKTGKKDSTMGADGSEEQHSLGTPTPGRKRKRKGGDSDDDDDEDDDSDDQADEDDEDEEEKEEKKGKKETCEDEDDGDQTASIEELEKQIEKLIKQQSQYRRKLFEASHSLRSMMFGQDRYKRRYWVLPQCGGVFVEGMESGEGLEEMVKEKEKLKNAANAEIKAEILEVSEHKTVSIKPASNYNQQCQEDFKEKANTNLFLQKPGSFSKLSKLLEVAKMPPESDIMKSGLPMMGLPFCGWPTGILSTNLPFSSPLPTLGSGFGLAEGSNNPFLTPSIPTIKSESPGPQNDKTSSAPSPAVEGTKPMDYPSPRPIPEEMQCGWWRITDPEKLKALLKVLHLRGIREKTLQKQIQKHIDYISQACIKNKDVTIIDVNETEEKLLTRKAVENWSVEQKAMEIDLAILQQVEDLERRVASASLQVKGWTYPELDSERDDLVYCEHKLLNKVCTAAEGEHGVEDDARDSSIERQSNNPLDLAVTRLAELERNIERRYLKSPLSTTIQIKLDNVGTVTVPAPAPSISGDGDGAEENIAPGLKVWRKALLDARSAAQVALCIQQLQKSIAWEKSIMKVYCQICRKGDNEELLLLCDGCDKGCHTYCHRPKITTIPEGDWFCPACIAKASGQSPKSKKHNKGKKCNDQKRGRKTSLSGEAEEEDAASTSSTPKKGGKEPKKRKLDEIISVNLSKQEIILPTKKPKATRDDSKDLAMCSMILSEMETHEDAWPFLLPVNLKLVPGYKKVIKKPMDFFTIREKLSNGQLPDHLTPPKKKKVCYEDLLKEEPLVCLSYGCGSNSFLFGIPCKFIGNSFWVSFVDSSSITTLL